MPRIPLGLDRVIGAPNDLLGALRMVASIARDTERMAKNTEVLDTVAADLKALPELKAEMSKVADAVATMDGRMAAIEAAMPVLVEVQKHLATLPETMDGLDLRLGELHVALTEMVEAIKPLGSVARRLPGGRRAARAAAAQTDGAG